jgi:geranylgeranyl diphosphate synthase type I
MSTGQLQREPSAGSADAANASGQARWHQEFRLLTRGALAAFLADRCAEHVHDVPGADFLTELLGEYADGGKYMRSTFVYLGWLAGCAGNNAAGNNAAGNNAAAVRAAASIELLHAFALLQDDVMDRSPMRRGRPAAHLRLADWYRGQGRGGDADRFGESAAILLSDLCLVWSGQMLRECGLGQGALARGWPYYDTLRGELAVGQFADLLYDARHRPPMADVLDMIRRKSGNYTVRRPLELGAALADCDRTARAALAQYGELVGEAFQLRDDVLGVFGRPAVTGKPNGIDLRERKATSVIVLAGEMATGGQRRQLDRFCGQEQLTDADIAQWRALIEETGAVGRIEQMIGSRVATAWAALESAVVEGAPLDPFVRGALRDLAVQATAGAR